jgi:hypothetical protein
MDGVEFGSQLSAPEAVWAERSRRICLFEDPQAPGLGQIARVKCDPDMRALIDLLVRWIETSPTTHGHGLRNPLVSASRSSGTVVEHRPHSFPFTAGLLPGSGGVSRHPLLEEPLQVSTADVPGASDLRGR